MYITFGPLIDGLGNILYGALFERSTPKETEIVISCLNNGQRTARFTKQTGRGGLCVRINDGENEFQRIEVHAGMFIDIISWDTILDQPEDMSIMRFADSRSGEKQKQLIFTTQPNGNDASVTDVWVSICAPPNDNKWSIYKPMLSSRGVAFSVCLLSGRPDELRKKYRRLARRIFRLKSCG